MKKNIFFGNTKYSKIVEEKLHEKFGLTAVVTLSDRFIGRKKILTPNPVKIFAEINNIPVITADQLNKEIIDKIAKYKPDFLVVADYGLFLPNELLDLPKNAPLNVHHSLLPKYRGPSPAPAAILNGDKISGVTIIKMSEKLDAGDILTQRKHELTADETTESLLTKLNELGGESAVEVIDNYQEYLKKAEKQDESKATFTKKIKKEDGYIDLSNLPNKEQIDQMIRAYYPWPGVWSKFKVQSSKFKVVKLLPGQKIQVEGKKPMSIKDFLNGYPQAKDLVEKIRY
ncbi:MAG: methionyl-tRNA formyltransferase [bacterium]|nr:methionyl-tRNA formyltransferase [bacterium]